MRVPIESNSARRKKTSVARADRVLDGVRHGDHQPLSQAEARGQDEHETGDGNSPERRSPGRTAGDDDRECKKEVVAHRGRDANRIVGEQAHEQRADRGCDAGGHEHGAGIHAGGAKHRRLHEDDVGHR